MKYKSYTETENNLILVFSEGFPITINKEDPRFLRIKNLIDLEMFEEIPYAARNTYNFNKIPFDKNSGIQVDEHNNILIKGEYLSAEIMDLVVDALDRGLNPSGFLSFLVKLKQDYEKYAIVDHYYSITESGEVIVTGKDPKETETVDYKISANAWKKWVDSNFNIHFFRKIKKDSIKSACLPYPDIFWKESYTVEQVI